MVSQNVTANGTSVATDVSRASNVVVHIKGGGVAGAGGNFTFEASVDSTNGTDGTWFVVQMVRTNANTIETTTGVLALAINTGNAYAWETSVNAYTYFRVRSTAYTSGTYVVSIIRGAFATEPVPAIPSHAVTLTSTTLTAVTPGTAAGNLGKAEDAAAASGDTGVFALSVRRDAMGTAQVSASGDYQEIATDINGAVWVRERNAPTTAITSVAGSATSVTLLALNTARRGATIYNDSTALLYLKLGATASTSSFTVKIVADGYYEVPFGYSGVIDGIWASATGNARITEVTV